VRLGAAQGIVEPPVDAAGSGGGDELVAVVMVALPDDVNERSRSGRSSAHARSGGIGRFRDAAERGVDRDGAEGGANPAE
jgi:hypothetical protein